MTSSLILTGLVTAALLAAQDGFRSEGGRQIYEPSFFDDISPRTAADMIFELPGFTVRDTGGGRGLGQGGTNVLIDGERVSGKGTGPLDILRRTSAEAVLRIEIVDGAALGIPGLTGQVADVKLKAAGLTGNWSWNPTFREGLEPDLLNASVSISGQKGVLDYTIGVDNDSRRRGNFGLELVTDADGVLIETRDEDAQFYRDEPSVSLAIGWDRANGHDANLTASYELSYNDNDELRRSVFGDGRENAQISSREEQEWNGEVGVDYALPMLGGRIKLIGIQSYEHSPIQFSLRRDGTDVDEDQFFDRVIDEGESILRAEQVWSVTERGVLEAALEGAFNFLEDESSVGTIMPDGQRLADSDPRVTRVEELRGQTSLAYSTPLGPFDVQASLGIEASQISQPGGATAARSFVRPRGFVSAAYSWGADTDLRLRMERRVGQLDFFDFVSSVDLTDGNATAGNPDLAPSQSWFAEAQVEQRFGPETQVTLIAYYERITDRVDRIPLGDGRDGPGNIDSATAWGASANGTIVLDDVLEGAELDFSGDLRDSRLDDPVTGLPRRFNNDLRWAWSFDFQQDVPNTPYAWGFGANDSQRASSFRINESFVDYQDPFAYAFAEHRDLLGLNVNVTVGNVFDQTEGARRQVFEGGQVFEGREGTRGALLFTEERARRFGPTLQLRISDTF